MSDETLLTIAVGAGIGLAIYCATGGDAPPPPQPQPAAPPAPAPTPLQQLNKFIAPASAFTAPANNTATIPPPPKQAGVQVFDYATIKANVKEADGIEAIENAFVSEFM